MSKVKHFQVKPEHVEAIKFDGRNAADICDWVNLFHDRYKVRASFTDTDIIIEHAGSGVVWTAIRNDWVVRSFINQYFYVEVDSVMADQYIEL